VTEIPDLPKKIARQASSIRKIRDLLQCCILTKVERRAILNQELMMLQQQVHQEHMRGAFEELN